MGIEEDPIKRIAEISHRLANRSLAAWIVLALLVYAAASVFMFLVR